MQKFIKNRMVLGGIAILISLLICFVFVPMIYNNKAEMITIVRVIKPISLGEVIKKENIDVVTVGGFNLPKSVVKSPKEVVGKYALADLKEDDYILSAKVGSEYIKKDNYLTNLQNDQMAVSISIKDLAQGVSGELQVNDIISIIVVESAMKSSIPKELRYVKVIGVSNSKGGEPDEENIVSTITVLADTKQALLLAAINEGATHFALVYRGDGHKAQELLDLQSAGQVGEVIVNTTSKEAEDAAIKAEAEKKQIEEEKAANEKKAADEKKVADEKAAADSSKNQNRGVTKEESKSANTDNMIGGDR